MLNIKVKTDETGRRAIEVEIAARLPDMLSELSDAVEAIDSRMLESGGEDVQETFRTMFLWGVLTGKFFKGTTQEDMERYGKMAAEHQERVEKLEEIKNGTLKDVLDSLNDALATLKKGRSELKEAKDELENANNNEEADKAIQDALKEAIENAKKKVSEDTDKKAEDENATE